MSSRPFSLARFAPGMLSFPLLVTLIVGAVGNVFGLPDIKEVDAVLDKAVQRDDPQKAYDLIRGNNLVDMAKLHLRANPEDKAVVTVSLELMSFLAENDYAEEASELLVLLEPSVEKFKAAGTAAPSWWAPHLEHYYARTQFKLNESGGNSVGSTARPSTRLRPVASMGGGAATTSENTVPAETVQPPRMDSPVSAPDPKPIAESGAKVSAEPTTPESEPSGEVPKLSEAEVAELVAQLEEYNHEVSRRSSAMYYRKGVIEEVEVIMAKAKPIAEKLRVPAEEGIGYSARAYYAYEANVKSFERTKAAVARQGGAGIPMRGRPSGKAQPSTASSPPKVSSVEVGRMTEAVFAATAKLRNDLADVARASLQQSDSDALTSFSNAIAEQKKILDEISPTAEALRAATAEHRSSRSKAKIALSQYDERVERQEELLEQMVNWRTETMKSLQPQSR